MLAAIRLSCDRSIYHVNSKILNRVFSLRLHKASKLKLKLVQVFFKSPNFSLVQILVLLSFCVDQLLLKFSVWTRKYGKNIVRYRSGSSVHLSQQLRWPKQRTAVSFLLCTWMMSWTLWITRLKSQSQVKFLWSLICKVVAKTVYSSHLAFAKYARNL